MIKSVGERDYSGQEISHLLLGLPLYKCTYSFVPLSLDGGYLITTTNSNPAESAVNLPILDTCSQRSRYSNTPNIMEMNLRDFTTTYSRHNHKLKR
jgi:hypothetical protein